LYVYGSLFLPFKFSFTLREMTQRNKNAIPQNRIYIEAMYIVKESRYSCFMATFTLITVTIQNTREYG